MGRYCPLLLLALASCKEKAPVENPDRTGEVVQPKKIVWEQAGAYYTTVTGGPSGVDGITAIPGGPMLATADQNIFRSEDGGKSWTPYSQERSFTFGGRLLTTPNRSVLMSDNYNWLHRSTDEGKSWTLTDRADRPSLVSCMFVDPEGAVYAVGYDNDGPITPPDHAGIYRSTDNGLSWNRLKTDRARFNAAAIATSGTILLGGHNINTIRSTDRGETWGQIFDVFSAATLLALPSGEFIYSGNRGTLRSADDGATWRGLSLMSFYELVGSGKTIYGFNEEGVFRSVDKGTNWESINTGLDDSTHVLTLYTTPSGALFAGTGKGIYRAVEQ